MPHILPNKKSNTHTINPSIRTSSNLAPDPPPRPPPKSSNDSPLSNTPDIAGGRSVFVSMELIEHQLSKARKRRRPNTMYKSKEDALRGGIPSSSISENTGALGGTEGSSQDIYNLPPSQ